MLGNVRKRRPILVASGKKKLKAWEFTKHMSFLNGIVDDDSSNNLNISYYRPQTDPA